ncbi:unnamed protein product [Nezara viridula]|uniref:Uncharacterized protein n=1 Tax=Nezara viridula TaxID=85310 RepID=A0A9P0HPX5_NEZVI|nr:unnamed protein product [Nezara viridula]
MKRRLWWRRLPWLRAEAALLRTAPAADRSAPAMEACGMSFIKYLLFFFNLVFAVSKYTMALTVYCGYLINMII